MKKYDLPKMSEEIDGYQISNLLDVFDKKDIFFK